MTVIQPIFYGGSGNSDIKLKSLTASASSLILAKNQSVDLQITPIMDLSRAELYDVSCDDSRVQLVKQPNHGLRVITPDVKFPSTTQTVIHFRATDDSGVSLDVPLTLQAGLNPTEAREWFNSHTSPKQLSPSFEPLPGWKPFKDYSSGAAIIACAIRYNKRYMVNIGDYFDETVDGNTYRWTIAEFNHYGRNEALMVAGSFIGTSSVVFNSSNSNTYSGSNLESVFNNFYNAMPSSLKSYVLNMSLPWTDKDGYTSYLNEYVFPPSEIEAFGETHYSKESPVYHSKWACFSDNNSRVRKRVDGSTDYCWLRSTYAGDANRVPIVDRSGTFVWLDSYFSNGALPCFCIA